MGLLQENFICEFCVVWGDGSVELWLQVDKFVLMLVEDVVW